MRGAVTVVAAGVVCMLLSPLPWPPAESGPSHTWMSEPEMREGRRKNVTTRPLAAGFFAVVLYANRAVERKGATRDLRMMPELETPSVCYVWMSGCHGTIALIDLERLRVPMWAGTVRFAMDRDRSHLGDEI